MFGPDNGSQNETESRVDELIKLHRESQKNAPLTASEIFVVVCIIVGLIVMALGGGVFIFF